MRNQNGQKIIQLNIPYDKYGRYGELSSKILYKFRSNLNFPGELNKKKHRKFASHQFISMIFFSSK